MDLCHLEWLIGERVPDLEMVVYEVLPYAPAQAERIVECLCVLAGLDVGQAGAERAARVRQAFGFIIDAARARQALLDLQAIESRLGKRPWRHPLKALRHDRGRFAAAVRDRSVRIAWRWALSDLGLAGRAGCHWLYYLRDNHGMLRKAVDRALEARLLLQGEPAAPSEPSAWCSSRAWPEPTNFSPVSPWAEASPPSRGPTGPGVRLVRLCLAPLGPLLIDDAIVWTIRRAQTLASCA
jgi:hypothetical protein